MFIKPCSISKAYKNISIEIKRLCRKLCTFKLFISNIFLFTVPSCILTNVTGKELCKHKKDLLGF